MPNDRDALSRHVVFPPDDAIGKCNEWCAPLHQFHERIASHPLAVYFDLSDFMLMSGWQRSGHPLLVLWKHRATRRYLNIDAAGEVWRYVESRRYSDRSPGTYRWLASLDEALERLRLEEMPWLDPERFGHLRSGTAPWDQETPWDPDNQ